MHKFIQKYTPFGKKYPENSSRRCSSSSSGWDDTIPIPFDTANTHSVWVAKAPDQPGTGVSKCPGVTLNFDLPHDIATKYNVKLPRQTDVMWPSPTKFDSKIQATVKHAEAASGVNSVIIPAMNSNQNVKISMKLTADRGTKYTVQTKRCKECPEEQPAACTHNAVLLAIKKVGALHVKAIGNSKLQTGLSGQNLAKRELVVSNLEEIKFVLHGKCTVQDDGIKPAIK